MRVWILMFIFGELVGTKGPLPYDLAECLVRVESVMEQFQYQWDHGQRMVIRGRIVTVSDFEVVCVEGEFRPAEREEGT